MRNKAPRKNWRKDDIEVSACVWDALEPNPKMAAEMRERSDLLYELHQMIRAQRWPRDEAAARCRVSLVMMNYVFKHRISRLSLTLLRAMVERAKTTL